MLSNRRGEIEEARIAQTQGEEKRHSFDFYGPDFRLGRRAVPMRTWLLPGVITKLCFLMSRLQTHIGNTELLQKFDPNLMQFQRE
jgi:hypothetical protein